MYSRSLQSEGELIWFNTGLKIKPIFTNVIPKQTVNARIF